MSVQTENLLDQQDTSPNWQWYSEELSSSLFYTTVSRFRLIQPQWLKAGNGFLCNTDVEIVYETFVVMEATRVHFFNYCNLKLNFT